MSDERRKRIHQLKTEVVSRAEAGEHRQAIELSEEFVDLIDKEGLTAHFGDFFEIPAQLYFLVGNMKQAEKYARLALAEVLNYGIPGPIGQMKAQALRELLSMTKWGSF